MDYIAALQSYAKDVNDNSEWLSQVDSVNKIPRMVNDIIMFIEGNFEDWYRFDLNNNKDVKEGKLDILKFDCKVTLWIVNSLKGRWASNSPGTFAFEEKEDAVAFKMVWVN